jgi:Fur family zinc uptake transcriptional regulator
MTHSNPTQMQARLDAARRRCEAAGGRLTDSRRSVLALLIEAHDPVSAYTLLDRLRERRGVATPPTVYRALNFLLEHGLAHRIERLNAFVACADDAGAPHKHAAEFLICRDCGGVTEIEDDRIGDAVREAAARSGFAPAGITVEVEGTCAACADRPG